jgi:predicted RND superfamily exporter protein
MWDLNVLEEIDKVETYLENSYGAEVKNSLVGTIKVVNRSANGGNPKAYKLPSSKSQLKKYRRAIRIINQGKYIRILLDENERTSRINGNFPDIGNHAIAKKNEAFKRFTESLSLKGKIEFKITGTAHLFDKNMRYLSENLVQGLSFEIVLVALIMGFLYKSVRMMIISMIPNLIPLLVISGIMGFCGVDLKISTAIIFTIALGIAIDDTIHILGKFKFERLKGKSKNYALKTAYLTTGKAMILTSLVLCSGFFMLVFSSFNGTFYMGLLLCITLFVALITELTLLPILIFMFYKPKRKG